MRLAVVPLVVAAMFSAAVGKISTIAGTGKPGYSGDGGPAAQATLNQPFHCDLDAAGNLYIAEANNHCIRKIDAKTGIISTVAGNGKKGHTGDGEQPTNATFNEPYAVAVDTNGDLYIVDRLNAVVRRVNAIKNNITLYAGNGKKDYAGDGKHALDASLREPNDCVLDRKGGLLIADVADWRIRRVDMKTGTITTFAGTGKPAAKVERGEIGDGGPATKAIIVGARAVCVDGKGNTYICEREGNAIRKVDDKGIITTIAGTGQAGYEGDGGPAVKATFRGPKAIRCDLAGNIYVVDTENHAIRKIDARTGVITTVAGGRKGGEGDGGDAVKAGLDRPHGCVIDARGGIYIADSNNNRVRLVRE
jgi:streptogramin lyase